jgi:hypothetical protein
MADFPTDNENKFIAKALAVTRFNLNESDFITNDNQRSIRHLYSLNLLPDLSDHYTSTVNATNLNRSISKLRTNSNFEAVVKTKYGQQGPGEVLMYLLVNGAKLAGQGQGGDLRVNNRMYEIKGAKKNKDDQYVDFNLGGTVAESDIISRIFLLGMKEKIITTQSRTEFNSTNMKQLRASDSNDDLIALEQLYAKRAYKYLSKYDMMFISTAAKTYGTILEVCNVPAARIQIERISQGRIRPAISCP